MAKNNIISLKAVSKLGFIKVLAVAIQALYYVLLIDYFGVSTEIESYFAATTFCGILLHFSLGGHILRSLLPVYHQFLNKYDADEATKVVWIVFNWITVGLSVLICCFILCSKLAIPFLLPGFSQSSQNLSIYLFIFLVPSVYFQTFNMIIVGFLNAKEIYNQGEINNLMASIISILLMVFGFSYFGIWVLVISIWCQHLVGFIANLKALKNQQISYQFVFSSINFDHKSFFNNTFYFLGFTICSQIYIIVLTALLSNFSGGFYAIYKYVEGIFLRIGGLFSSAATTIFYTKYIIALQEDEGHEIAIFNRAIKLNLLIAVFTISVIIGTSADIVEFLWQKKLDVTETKFAVTLLYSFFSILLFNSFGELFPRMSIASGHIKRLYIGWSIARTIATIYAYLSITYFGVRGLLSLIIINRLLDNVLFYIIINKTNQLKSYKMDLYTIIKFTLISIALFFVCSFLNTFSFDLILFKNERYGLLFSILIKAVIVFLPFAIYLLLGFKNQKIKH